MPVKAHYIRGAIQTQRVTAVATLGNVVKSNPPFDTIIYVVQALTALAACCCLEQVDTRLPEDIIYQFLPVAVNSQNN
jgi:cytochrome c556